MPSADPERLATLAASAIAREFPTWPGAILESEADLRLPRDMHPCFYGSFDWHSAVHGHWTLARLARCHPQADWAPRVREVLRQRLQPHWLDVERAYLERFERFERPYGLAWLLLLGREIEDAHVLDADAFESLGALIEVSRRNLTVGFTRLPRPIRGGQHSQSAFSLGLALDVAREQGDTEQLHTLEGLAEQWFGDDPALPFHFEPDGYDFLSPALGAADVIRRVRPSDRFTDWLTRALPSASPDHPQHAAFCAWLTPVASPDRSDGKLSHLDGLNLSRAWMLDGVVGSLASDDPRRDVLRSARDAHLGAGIDEGAVAHWAGSHWLASFATYALSRRGAGPAPTWLTP